MRLYIVLIALLAGCASVTHLEPNAHQDTPIQFFETECTKGWRTSIYEERGHLWHYKFTIKHCSITA